VRGLRTETIPGGAGEGIYLRLRLGVNAKFAGDLAAQPEHQPGRPPTIHHVHLNHSAVPGSSSSWIRDCSVVPDFFATPAKHEHELEIAL
jgi:hypothetical protein